MKKFKRDSHVKIAKHFFTWRRVEGSNLQGLAPAAFQERCITILPTLPDFEMLSDLEQFCYYKKDFMKYLGIDFGSKRVGLAISDENGQMAFPYSVVSNDKNLFTEIEKIIKNEKVDEVVIGESKDFKGKSNKIMTAIKKFKGEFEVKTKLKVWLDPEFMTSVQADRSIISRRSDTKSHQRSIERQGSKKEMLDASAATIILQSFLDKKKCML